MADRLTQLQDCLDDLSTQMFASLRYIQTRHAYAPIDGQPDQNPFASSTPQIGTGSASVNINGADQAPQTPAATQTDPNGAEVPDSPEAFQSALRELARDLVIKEQQIEYLISVLPGIGTSEQDQNRRVQALQTELRQLEEERKTAAKEKDAMLDTLGMLVANCKRVY